MSSDFSALKFSQNSVVDETPFFRLAILKFLRENNLSDTAFEELNPRQQSRIITDAQAFKDQGKASVGHEGVVGNE